MKPADSKPPRNVDPMAWLDAALACPDLSTEAKALCVVIAARCAERGTSTVEIDEDFIREATRDPQA